MMQRRSLKTLKKGELPSHESSNGKTQQCLCLKKRKAFQVLALSGILACLSAKFLFSSPAGYSKARRHPPQMVQFDYKRGNDVSLPIASKAYLEEEEDDYEPPETSEENNESESEEDENNRNERAEEERTCVFQNPPPSQNLVACNNMHEISMMPKEGHFRFVHAGGARNVFQLIDTSDQSSFAMKTSHFHKETDERLFRVSTQDAMIMERLTSSPYIANIYASCGSSQLVEYATAGNMHELIKIARKNGYDRMSSIDKLKICIQIAGAAAAIHDLLGVSHNDLCCHQYIYVNGVYKLNDFHLARYMKTNTVTNEYCPATSPWYAIELFKIYPPEMSFDWEAERDLSKVDVYLMADTMFYVLSKRWMYENVTGKETLKLLRQGQHPKIPSEYLDSKDPAIKAMVKAIVAGWTPDPKKRPPARTISNWLTEALQEIQHMEKLGVVHVEVPPLPKNYRHTESDYYSNFGY